MLIREFVKQAMFEINALAPGEDIEDADGVLGVDMSNELIDQWAGMRVTTYETRRVEYQLVPNQRSYTIADNGADWTGWRPVDQPERAGFVDVIANPADPVEYRIRIYTDEEWANVSLKQLVDTIVFGIWYQKSFPLGVIWVYPVCSEAQKIALYVPTPLSETVTLDTDLAFPPSGRKAFRLALAMAMAPSLEIPVTNFLMKSVGDAFNVYVKSFARKGKLQMPMRLLAQNRRRGYNIITNEGGN